MIVKEFDATSEGSSFSDGVCDAPFASGDCIALSDGCSSLEVAVLGVSDSLGHCCRHPSVPGPVWAHYGRPRGALVCTSSSST